MSRREALQAAFRAAAADIDPATHSFSAPDPSLVRAWLTVQSVRTQPRWIAAAEAAVMPIGSGARAVPDEDVAEWVLTCCSGWVQRASGPFRGAADRLVPRLSDDVRAVPALLAWWRITGQRAPRDRALRIAAEATTGLPAARALHAAWLATADDSLRQRALDALPGASDPRTWPLASDLSPDQDWDPALLAPLAPADRLLAVAPLAAPPLHLKVAWFIPEELAEGPMAEAATFPWPALRIRFVPLPRRDQLRFTARLGEGPVEELEDVGVVAAWLEEVTRAADRGPLLDGTPARTRRRGGLRRR